MFSDVQAARKARNASKAAPAPEPRLVKTPESVEASFKRMAADLIIRAQSAVAEAQDNLNKTVTEINDPNRDSRNLWPLETLGNRLEKLTEKSVSLSVKMAMQDEVETDRQNGYSFREACRRERERMIERLAFNGSGRSSSAYHDAHESVKVNALRTSLSEAIQTLGWEIDELDAIAAEGQSYVAHN
jgi:hypothetical protein